MLPTTVSLSLGVDVPKPTYPLFSNIISPVPSASIKCAIGVVPVCFTYKAGPVPVLTTESALVTLTVVFR